MPETLLPIAQVLPRLREQYGDRCPSYAMFTRAVVEGRVPARKDGKSWLIDVGDWDRVTTGLRLGRPAPRRVA
jgi:hypothetical protein